MRLYEIICAVAMFSVISAGALASMKPGLELYDRTVELERKVERDSFLAKGFINVCKDNDGKQLKEKMSEWREMCLSMWSLDYLECEEKGDSYCQTWKKDGFAMRVEYPMERLK
ncbi:MAG: hypothetical protein J5857_06095 [Treponema sp.]|nr:hypothetical protein [Treponema sp.]